MPSVDDYLIAAWLRGAPDALVKNGFPRGFWPDVARTAVELALAGRLDAPLSFRPTMATRGGDEGRPEVRTVKGVDISRLEIKL
jgi:hypothetical protein